MVRRVLAGIVLVAALCGAAALSRGRVTDVLIARAWVKHVGDGAPHRPWPWTDAYPVARVEVPRLRVERMVMEGRAGGPVLTHAPGTAAPNADGWCEILGRGAAADFVTRLRKGDAVLLTTRETTRTYRVDAIGPADGPRDHATLELIAGGTTGLVVRCTPVPGEDAEARRWRRPLPSLVRAEP